jgi:ABC-2 type transport system permease protein
MTQVAIIIKREMLIYFRDKGYIISSLARPLLWLFALGYGIGSSFKLYEGASYLHFIFPGIIAMTLKFTSVFFAISIIWDREFGFLKVILVAPISRGKIVFAKSLSGSMLAIFQGSLVLFLSPLFKIHLNLWQFLLTFFIMILSSFGLTSLGIIISSRMSSFEKFSLIMNFILMPMFFLSGAMFPIKNLPEIFFYPILLNPMTYSVDLLRYSTIGIKEFPLTLNFFVLFCFSIFSFVIAWKNFEKKD